MKQRSTAAKALGVIGAVFVLPLCVWGYSLAAPAMSSAAAGSAGLALGVIRLPQENTSEPSVRIYASAPPSSSKWDMEAAPEEVQEHLPEAEPVGIESAKPSAEVLSQIPYPDDQESRDGVIEKMNFGHYDGSQYFDLDGGGQVRNCTSRSNQELYEESKKDIDFSLDYEKGEPLVLIYHTHATESYEPADRDFYDSSFQSKTTDPAKSVIEVGERICAQLEQAGIPYIHDTLIHDLPSYNAAYDSSRKTVKELLAEYPSVRIVLDIHRDAIQREDGTRLMPVAEIEGREAAQIMIISGCDDGTMGMPEHIKNFHFACALQSRLESSYEGLTRPILFDYRHYNQDLTTGSLLIEVGGHGNSLEQAFYSGELIGKALAELIQQG